MITDVEITDGIITATGLNPVIESEPLEQSIVENDYRKITEYRVYQDNPNLVTASIIGMITLSINPIGKKLLLVKNDDTVISTGIIDVSEVTLNVDVYEVDISGVENTEVIEFAITKPEHFINDVELVYQLEDIHIDRLSDFSIVKCDDLIITPTKSLVNKIKLSLNSTIKEINYNVTEIDYEVGNEIHTSNVLPVNVITSVGLTTPDDAYRVFDNVDEPAFTEVVPADGVVDIQHIYEFDTPTTCYGFKFKVGSKETAPSNISMYGSLDGVEYTELKVVELDVGVDNIEFTKYFDVALCNDYTHYKITISAGTPDGVVSINKYELIKELVV